MTSGDRVSPADPAMTELLVVDDHPLYREGVVAALRQQLPGVTVHCAADAQAGLQLLQEHPGIEAVLLDLHLPGLDGFGALALYAGAFPHVARLLISGQDVTAQTITRALAAGASGFIPKTLGAAEIEAALRKVLAGDLYVPAVDTEPAPVQGLSLRQLEVLSLLVSGQANKEIARELGIAERTVKAHITRIFEVLQVSSRVQAVVAAQRLGLGGRA